MEITSQEDWLKWRKSGLGASDAPILMEQVDWGTPMSLYEDKISDEIKDQSDVPFPVQLGNEAEPKIRSLHELAHMKTFTPCLGQSADFPFVIASYDGRTADRKETSEYKLLNAKDWEVAKRYEKGEIEGFATKALIPAKYYTQIQHQFIASPQTEVCWFGAYLFSHYKDKVRKNIEPMKMEYLALVPVYPDKEFQVKLLTKEAEFWQQHVLKKKPPVPSSKDFVPVTGHADKIKWYLELDEKMAALKKEHAKAKKEVENIAKESGHPRVLCAGLKMTLVARAGTFDFKSIPEIATIQKEAEEKIKGIVDSLPEETVAKHTKAGTTYWKLTPMKDEEKENAKQSKSKSKK